MNYRAMLPAVTLLVAGCNEFTPPSAAVRSGVAPSAAIIVNTVTDLGSLGGVPGSGLATDINEAGQIVGASQLPSGVNGAFLWTSSGGMVDLGNLGGVANAQAFGINDSGHVVGLSRNAAGWDRAFLWKPSTGMVDLGSVGGGNSLGADINNLGHVTGSTTAFFAGRAFFWSASTGMQALGTLGGIFSAGSAINDSDMIAGSSSTTAGPFHAFRWTSAGGLQDLGTLGGATSFARGINNLGHVVGVAQDALGRDRAFLWTPSGGMQDLGTLPGGTTSEAEAINDHGVVTGYTTPGFRAFAWSASTGMVFLGGLGGSSGGDARNLNDHDQIVGTSPNLTAFRPVLWSLQPSNIAPTARAGADQTVECAAGCAIVALDGSASTDPDDGIATYEWREGLTLVATGATPSVQFALGVHTVTLKVTDHGGLSSTDDVVITVRDTQAPVIALTLSATTLWPPNHAMRKVASGIGATDACDGNATVVVTVSSNEPENGLGDGDTPNDWQVVSNGDGTFDVYVRAERAGGGAGRVYTISVTATDASGNSASTSTTVTVPKSQGKS